MNPGPAQPMQGSAQPMPDAWQQWGPWSDPQEVQMTNWLPPTDEQMEQNCGWFCQGDETTDLMMGWNQPPAPDFDNFETPQKIGLGPRVQADDWTPPKHLLMGGVMPQEHAPDICPWYETTTCGINPWMVAPDSTEVPYSDVPPLPIGSEPEPLHHGAVSPPLTPRHKKTPSGPLASPVPTVTPQPRATPKVPMSVGGQTSLPATPHRTCWVPETPSPHRMHYAAPVSRPPFADVPNGVFPPEMQPPPWA